MESVPPSSIGSPHPQGEMVPEKTREIAIARFFLGNSTLDMFFLLGRSSQKGNFPWQQRVCFTNIFAVSKDPVGDDYRYKKGGETTQYMEHTTQTCQYVNVQQWFRRSFMSFTTSEFE
jgi:hypothetical protein